MITTYNCFVNAVPTNGWTATGGTAVECIGKTTVDPAAPSETKYLAASSNGIAATAKVGLPGGLAAALAAGGKVIGATVHVRGNATVAGGTVLKFGFNGQAVYAEPTWVKEVSEWHTVSLSKAQAEELTAKKIEEQVLLLEHLTPKTLRAFELYLSVEVEEAAGSTFADSPTTTAKPKASVTETLAYADTSSTSGRPAATDAETLAYADAGTASIHATVGVTDGLVFADTTTATIPPTATVTEIFTSGAEDNPAAALSLRATASETLTGTDSPSSQLRPAATSIAAAAFADRPAAIASLGGALVESRAYTDQAAARLAPSSVVHETNTYSSAGTVTAEVTILLSERAVFSDASASPAALSFALVERWSQAGVAGLATITLISDGPAVLVGGSGSGPAALIAEA